MTELPNLDPNDLPESVKTYASMRYGSLEKWLREYDLAICDARGCGKIGILSPYEEQTEFGIRVANDCEHGCPAETRMPLDDGYPEDYGRRLYQEIETSRMRGSSGHACGQTQGWRPRPEGVRRRPNTTLSYCPRCLESDGPSSPRLVATKEHWQVNHADGTRCYLCTIMRHSDRTKPNEAQ